MRTRVHAHHPPTRLAAAVRPRAAAAPRRPHAPARPGAAEPAAATPGASASISSFPGQIGVAERHHVLPDGTPLEVQEVLAARASARPPLLFVHGSGHAAWCWAQHWLPWFGARGWDSHAVSLRGRGKSGAPPPGAAAGGTLASHAADVASVAAALRAPPVLVGHSFGGLVVQAALAPSACPPTPAAGAALVCSAPPSGNGPMVARITRDRGLLFSARLTWNFVTKAYLRRPGPARDTLFSPALPEADLQRYLDLLIANDGETPVLDVRALGREVPIARPAPPPPPAFVLGSDADAVVDVPALHEAAEHMGAPPPVVLTGMGHDVMLDAGWEGAAGALEAWLRSTYGDEA